MMVGLIGCLILCITRELSGSRASNPSSGHLLDSAASKETIARQMTNTSIYLLSNYPTNTASVPLPLTLLTASTDDRSDTAV